MGVKSATTYDDFGNATENVIQPSADALFMKTQTTYTDNGNYVASQKDARGLSVVNWLDANGKVLGVTDPEGNSVTYAYDNSNRITGVTAVANDKVHKNSYTYENDRLKSISHNTTSDTENDVTYTFEYDALGRKKKVKVGNTTLSENVYSTDRKGLLTEMNFGNGAKIRYEYDAFGRTTAIYVDEPDPNNEGNVIVSDTAKYEFKYDARGIASVIKDNVLMTETRVTSDLADRPSESVTKDANGNLILKSQLNYDGKNRVKEFIDILPGSTHKTAYTYDADNRVTEVKFDDSDTHKVNYSYDLLNRITTKCVTNGVAYTTTYGFVDGDTATYGANATTPLISTITQGSGENAMNFAYTYDNRGNITSETRFTDVPSDGVTVSYEYDELGQLIRVNDPNDTTAGTSGTTWIYTYDRGGNMVQRAQCAFTTDDTVIPMYTREYLYDENWKDQLVANGPYPLTYDAIGNLKTYGGWTYEWESGRQLKRQTQNTTVITYDYDNKGMRTRKIVSHTNGYVYTDYHYIYSGTKLIHLTRNTDSLYFYYDSQGRPAKVNYNGAVYTYLHNLQGDIVGIIDETGALVVEYKYNAWGTLLSRTGTMSNTLGYANPFRYRGYIFDDETWMYWLRSRYYYPELGRFVNVDTLFAYYYSLLSLNSYAYCKNNPICFFDENGNTLEETISINTKRNNHVQICLRQNKSDAKGHL